MAYDPLTPPDPIPLLGALHTEDIFRYFKESILYYAPNIDEDIEQWPRYYDSSMFSVFKIFNDAGWTAPGIIDSSSPMPITRAQFYDYIDVYKVSSGNRASAGRITAGAEFIEYRDFFADFLGVPIYEHEQTANNWPFDAVRAWGKVKSCELALFGSVANGGGLSDQSIITTGTLRDSIESWSIFDQSYLRAALVNLGFDAGCFNIEFSSPPPTNVSANISTRMITWTDAPGRHNPSDYLYSLRGSEFVRAASKPIDFGADPLNKSDFIILTAGAGYLNDSLPVGLSTDVPPPNYVLELYLSPIPSAGGETLYILSEYPLPIAVIVTGIIQYTALGNIQREEPFVVILYEGALEGNTEIMYSDPPINDLRTFSNVEYPSNVNGISLSVIY